MSIEAIRRAIALQHRSSPHRFSACLWTGFPVVSAACLVVCRTLAAPSRSLISCYGFLRCKHAPSRAIACNRAHGGRDVLPLLRFRCVHEVPAPSAQRMGSTTDWIASFAMSRRAPRSGPPRQVDIGRFYAGRRT